MFYDLEIDFADKTVLLDVDGTLGPDNRLNFNESTKRKIEELKAKNEVFICTNSRDNTRRELLRSSLNLPIIESSSRKPNPAILREINSDIKDYVVIGDKFLTDGLLAKQLRARFIHVRRQLSGEESLAVRTINLIDDTAWKIYNLFVSMRPKQWVKNVFVFLPLLFANEINRGEVLIPSISAFVTFCLASSAVYLLNDVLDIENDRNHPIKKYRPLASGQISSASALGFALLNATLAVRGSFILNNNLGIIILSYLTLNLLYCFYLKHVVIIDILTIALGFVLRVGGGAIAIGSAIPFWGLAFTFFLLIFLTINKRHEELSLQTSNTRNVLRFYSPAIVDWVEKISFIATIIAYTLYVTGPDKNPLLILTIPIVFYVLFLFANGGPAKSRKDSDPVNILKREPQLFYAVILWILVSVAIRFIPN